MIKKITSMFLCTVIIFSIFSVYTPSAEAVVQDLRCCEKTVNGEYCMYTDAKSCDANFNSAPTACEQTSYCQLGCGVDEEVGVCYKNVPRSLAQSKGEGIVWLASPECNDPKCTRGCCTIGTECSYVTQTRCKTETQKFPFVQMDFKDAASEQECVDSCRNNEMGCCVSQDTCSWTARESCGEQSADIGSSIGFHKDTFCSDKKLSCDCASHHHKACYKEDVYWFDSCGNPEDIAEDCDYASGTLCKAVDEANAKCNSVDCSSVYKETSSPASGGDKKNGESWCLYDGATGWGRDAVGSRQFRQICINGETTVEPCADYREQICVQGILGSEPLSTGTSFTLLASRGEYIEGRCRENRWADCAACNVEDPTFEEIDSEDAMNSYVDKLEDAYKCCTELQYRDCYWWGDAVVKSTGNEVSKDSPGKCVPMVPPGFTFWGDDLGSASFTTGSSQSGSGNAAAAATSTSSSSTNPTGGTNIDACEQASSKCEVTYAAGGWTSLIGKYIPAVGGISDKWKCVRNCHCLEKDWLLAQSTSCIAQGDCGAYFNYLGVFTDEGFTYNKITIEDAAKGKWDEESGLKLTKSEVTKFLELQFPADKYKDQKPGMLDELDRKGGWMILSWMALTGIASWGHAGWGWSNIDKIFSGFALGPKSSAAMVSKQSTLTGVRTEAFGLTGQAAITYDLGLNSIGQEELANGIRNLGTDNVFIGKDFLYTNTQNGWYKYAINADGSLGNQVASSAADAKGATSVSKYSSTGGAAGGFMQLFNTLLWIYTIYQVVDIVAASEKTKTIVVNCAPWEAPDGGRDCEECNKDPIKPCSEYRCKSLGKYCTLLNPGTGNNETCVNMHPNDVNAPIIKPWPEKLKEGYTLREITYQGNPGFEIQPKVKAFQPITFGIRTNEPAQCKISANHSVKYNDMPAFYVQDSLYRYNQSSQLMLPNASYTDGNQVIQLVNGNTVTLYIRCQDGAGNANENDYFVRFSIDPSPDLTAPVIEQTSLTNGAMIAANKNDTDLSVYVSEPARCKWDFNDVDYISMNTSMQCATAAYDIAGVFGGLYECKTKLTGIKPNQETNYYFKCEDMSKNFNEDSYKFSLKGTEALKVVSIGPSGELYTNNVTLKVLTEKGADNGKAMCAFADKDTVFENMVYFFKTNETLHEQPLILPMAEYKYYVACRDAAGNQVNTNTTFRVTADTTAPKLMYIFTEGTLYIETDEDCSCESGDKNFRFGEGNKMTGDNSKVHETSLSYDKFYVKCKDIYGNLGEYIIYTEEEI